MTIITTDGGLCHKCQECMLRQGQKVWCEGCGFERTKPICDFCSSPDAPHAYTCSDFLMDDKLGVGSTGAWAACDACKGFIDANNLDGLVEHAVTLFREMGPGIPDDILDGVREMLRKTHGEFMKLHRQAG